MPIVSDSVGRIPAFWLADGTYRGRLTTSTGVQIFDTDYILAIGPSSGAGGGSAVDANALFSTGMTLWMPISGTKAGWVRHNARTIGSATSGAAERANSDVQSLYEYLWNNYSNTLCAVTTGRGASAAADWSANKPIATLDLRGKGPSGLDDMGNSAASVFSGVTFTVGDATTAASSGGASRFALTTDHLPTLPIVFTNPSYVLRNTLVDVAAGSTETDLWKSQTSGVTTSGAASITTGGQAHTIMNPFMLGTWYVRL